MLLIETSYVMLGNEIKFDSSALNYGLFSTMSRNVHCDAAFLAFKLGPDAKSDYETSCGMACRDLLQYSEAATLDLAYWQNKHDHTQFIKFSSNTSFTIGKAADTMIGSVKDIFAFRGTVGFDVLNHRRNFFFRFAASTMCANCMVHQGFWRNFLSLRPTMVETYTKDAKIAVTGMSMGAPLASLAAMTIAGPLGGNVIGCVTYGMPRVANSVFAKEVLALLDDGLKTPGFAYARDPVPHVPPRFLGYRSTQHMLFHTLQHYLQAQALDMSFHNTRIDDYDIGEFIFFDKVYMNFPSSFDGDKEFAGSSKTYQLMDHLKYFDMTGVQGCGFDSSDRFLHVSNAAELFFI